jgi:hypothetical protein
MARVRIGIDVGGTFTDPCLFDEETGVIVVAKVPSTPTDASLGLLAGWQTILERHGTQASDVVYLAHGTTVATNTLMQHTGARTGLLTTRGFRDLLEIGRQTRPDLYDLQVERPEPLIRRDLRLEVSERIDSDGRILTPLDTDETMAAIAKLKAVQVEAVAICFLSAYVSPVHEAQVKAMATEAFPEVYLSVSHEVLTVPLPSGTLGLADFQTLLQHFYQAHERTYGYYAADEPTQLLTFRLEALGVVPKAPLLVVHRPTADAAERNSLLRPGDHYRSLPLVPEATAILTNVRENACVVTYGKEKYPPTWPKKCMG